jgi:ABC-type lipoprotein export system ATPase subunit
MELFSAVNAEFGISIVQVTHSAACAAAGRGVIRIDDGRIIDE